MQKNRDSLEFKCENYLTAPTFGGLTGLLLTENASTTVGIASMII